MNEPAEVRCRCGTVRGTLADAAPGTVNRVVCYCADCQAFLHHLHRTDLLDPYGGSDIVQVAPAALSFTQGAEHIVGLRLTPQGLYRFYADCCKTPLGNMVGPAVPFVGIVAQALGSEGENVDAIVGKPIGGIYAKYAVGQPPGASRGLSLGLMLRAMRLVLGWWLRGRASPHPFFERKARTPRYPLTVLAPAEREALRPLCGPQATTISR